MAADILLYKATHVPVGADQNTELSRDIAQKFNNDFNCKDFFHYQNPLFQKYSKGNDQRWQEEMSKSEASDYSRINLKDNADEIIKKLKRQNQTLT